MALWLDRSLGLTILGVVIVPCRFKAANPFSFMSLFNPASDYNACPDGELGRKGDMAKLALVCGIQQGTTSGMSDPQFPLIAGRLGWGSGKMGLYQSAQGVANVVSGYLTGPVLRHTGRVKITYLGNVLQTLSYIGTGLAGSGASMMGALALRAPVNENSAVQAMLVAQAKRLNIGQGRLAADVANFSAVTKAITPMLYGFAAKYSVRYPFFMVRFPAYFWCLLAQLLSVSNIIIHHLPASACTCSLRLGQCLRSPTLSSRSYRTQIQQRHSPQPTAGHKSRAPSSSIQIQACTDIC